MRDLIILTHPGRTLSAEEKAVIHRELQDVVDDACQIELKNPSDVGKATPIVLEYAVEDGDYDREDYESYCAAQGAGSGDDRRLSPDAAQRFMDLRAGQGVAYLTLPLSEEKAEQIYHRAIEISRRHGLEMRGTTGDLVDIKNPGRLPPGWGMSLPTPPPLPGFFISFENCDDSPHFVGGEHSIDGAICPNCRLPLLLHLTLSTADERLGLQSFGSGRLPLLYCMRCNLQEDDFVYRVLDQSGIEILEYSEGCDEAHERDWREVVRVDCFEQRPFALLPIPPRVQVLLDIMNRWCAAPADEISEEQQRELETLVSAYDDPALKRAHMDVVNQVGGRPFLNQGLWFPDCPHCERTTGESKPMTFLANLTNDGLHNVIISFSSVYITFFICPHCRTVHVEHRI